MLLDLVLIAMGVWTLIAGAVQVYRGWRDGIFRGKGGIRYREDPVENRFAFWVNMALRAALAIFGALLIFAGFKLLLAP